MTATTAKPTVRIYTVGAILALADDNLGQVAAKINEFTAAHAEALAAANLSISPTDNDDKMRRMVRFQWDEIVRRVFDGDAGAITAIDEIVELLNDYQA